MLPHVFDLFVRCDRARAHTRDGMGVGLTLVRHLVTLHGGRVSAESDGAGRGAEFTVRLPLAVDAGVSRSTSGAA
jgi:signal transduction histidine kinase